MIDRKKIFIIVGVFVAVFIILLLVSFMRISSNNSIPSPATPTPVSGQPTGAAQSSVGSFRVLSALPIQNRGPYLPVQKITVMFSGPVLIESIIINTSPTTQVNIIRGQSPDEVYIIPKSSWSRGATTVTVSSATEIWSTRKLMSPFVYSITTSLPTIPPEALEGNHP